MISSSNGSTSANSSSAVHYLDNAGAALPSRQLLQAVAHSLLNGESLANPHSGPPLGRRTRDLVEMARKRVLAHFGISSAEFALIFTANATAGLKLLAEGFVDGVPVGDTSMSISTDLKCLQDHSKRTLLIFRDSHTSILGMRQTGNFDQMVVTDFEELEAFLLEMEEQKGNNQPVHNNTEKGRNCLFVMTGMSNFCGRVYNLGMVQQFKRVLGVHWSVCVDAAALAPHSAQIGVPDCDFAVLSFYKMFGYPTGIGALLVHRECAALLQRRYFGGGTVKFASVHSTETHFRDSIEERFEDGTSNFYAIYALLLAFSELEKGTTRSGPFQDCAMELAERTFHMLATLRHGNGTPIAKVYGHGWEEHISDSSSRTSGKGRSDGATVMQMKQGPIVNFNLLRDDGSFIGFAEMAELFSIQLRTGCHCNLGACALHLGLSESVLRDNFQKGKVCGDDTDLAEGVPLGSVRVSYGRTSSEQDVLALRRMLEMCFVNSSGGPFTTSANNPPPSGFGLLTHLFVYPVKSWPVCPLSGSLMNDRRWMVVSFGGDPLSQKRTSDLCSVEPNVRNIGADGCELTLRDRQGALPPLRLSLDRSTGTENRPKGSDQKSLNCWNGHAEWTNFGGERASLWLGELHHSLEGSRLVVARATGDQGGNQNFANQADFLLVARASVRLMAEHLSLPLDSVIERFRPNLVVDFGPEANPFDEENIEELSIGSVEFRVVGMCRRCQMICVDQRTGEKDPNVLIGLRNLRIGKKLNFGIYLQTIARNSTFGSRELRVGNGVRVTRWKHTNSG